MEMKGFAGLLYRISEWIMRIFVINLLWAICSFPSSPLMILLLLHIPWGMAGVGSINDMYNMMLLWGLLTPITFFPATAAVFAVVRKWQMGDTDIPLFKSYFRAFKENYKQSFLGGLLYVILIGLLAVNIYFYISVMADSVLTSLSYLFVVLIVVTFISIFNFFSITVHLEMGTIRALINAILMTVGRPMTTFLLITSNFFILYMSFMVSSFTFLVPFFTGTLMAFLSFFYFNQAFTRMQDKVFEKEGYDPRDKQSSKEDEDPEEDENETRYVEEPTYFHLKNK